MAEYPTGREPLTGPERLSLKATAARWHLDPRPADARRLASAFVALMTERDMLADQVAGRDQQIERVRAIHYPTPITKTTLCEFHQTAPTKLRSGCPDCVTEPVTSCANLTCCFWPCPTIVALDGEPQSEATDGA